MKLTRIAALLLLICIALSALASCGADGKQKNYLGDEKAELSELFDTSLVTEGAYDYSESDVTALDLVGQDVVASGGSIMVLNDAEKPGFYSVVDIDSGDELMTYEDENKKSVSVSVLGGELIVFERKINVYGVGYKKIYNVGGKLVAETEDTDASIDYVPGVLTVGQDVYSLDDSCEAVSHFEVPRYLSPSDISFGEKYAAIETDGGLAFYSPSFEQVATLAVPKSASGVVFSFLGADTAFISYVEELAPDAESYDFFSENRKFDVFAATYSVESGKISEIKENVYPIMIATAQTLKTAGGTGLKEDIPNIIAYYPIEDGRIAYDSSSVRYSFIGEDGKIGDRIDEMTEGQIGLLEPVVNTGYYAKLDFGSALLSRTGEVVAKFPTDTVVLEKEFGFVAISDGHVACYDEDYEIKFQSSSAKLVAISDEMAIFVSDSGFGSYYQTFNGTSVARIDNYFANGIYAIGMNIYTVCGELLMTASDTQLIAYSDKTVVIRSGGSYYSIRQAAAETNPGGEEQ